MNKAEFDKTVGQNSRPVVVDFWASWCKPCMMSKPVLEKLAHEFDGRVSFVPVNADESREVLESFRIMGIPTVMAFRNGEEVARIVGAQNEAGYRGLFESLASGGEIKVPISPFNRMLRMGAGAVLVMAGMTNHNGWLISLGVIVAFFGVYDRCPLWAAITGWFKNRTK